MTFFDQTNLKNLYLDPDLESGTSWFRIRIEQKVRIRIRKTSFKGFSNVSPILQLCRLDGS
jgi:hypothetical protein